MTGQPSNTNDGTGAGMGRGAGQGPGVPDVMPAGALIRASADGELNAASAPEQTALMERLLTDPQAAAAAGVPGAAARMAFEKSLRPACGRCLCAMAGAPSAGLRARVEAAIAQEHPAEGVVGHPAGREMQREPGAAPGRARSGVRRAPGRRWAVSLGASAILLFALVAIYQAVINAGTVTSDPQTITAQLASFVSTEHERTSLNSDVAKAKFGCTDVARICTDFGPTLGESPTLPPLGGEHELTFQGAGPCGVPGGPSIHLRFFTRHDAAGHSHEMSLFVQRDTGRLDLVEGRVYSLECPNANVDVWRKGALIYYLVSDDRCGCDCFRQAAGVAAPSGVVRAK